MLRRYTRKPRRRRNPLKPKLFKKKLAALRKMGLETETAKEIETEFNREWNDPSHAIYILDWWKARLSLVKYLDTDDERYLDNIARYAHRYKIDYHDLSLDDELQIDHYASFRHYAHLAENNPYFRAAWPKHLYKVTHKNPRWQHYHWNREPRNTVTFGEIREHDSQTRDGRPAIKLLTGENRVVSETTLSRIAKEDISDISESTGPSSMLSFLKDMESNMRTSRYFEPEHHDVLLQFPDGKAWVVIRGPDVRKEASSLGDCGSAENPKTILISLREPVTKTYYQALLKAEIAFPEISNVPSLGEIRNNAGVIVQLRGYRNSKPSVDLHPYIVPLLQQPWIVHTVEPNYSSSNTFHLEDLDSETSQELRAKKRYLFVAKTFYKRQRHHFSYPKAVRDKILNNVTMDPGEMLTILSAKRYRLIDRRKALSELKKRLTNGTKYMRGPLLDAAEGLLKNTKSKPLIKDIFGCLKGHKRQRRAFLDFYALRKDWLFENLNFFLELFTDSLPNKPDSGRGYYHTHPYVLLPEHFQILQDLLTEYEEAYFEFVFKLLYDNTFHSKNQRYIRVLYEQLLGLILDDTKPGSSYSRVLSRDLCSWFQEMPGGWGSTEHRMFSNRLSYSTKLGRQLVELVRMSAEKRDGCYLDLAVTLYASMSGDDRGRVKGMAKALFDIIMDGGYLSREAYEALGRVVNS